MLPEKRPNGIAAVEPEFTRVWPRQIGAADPSQLAIEAPPDTLRARLRPAQCPGDVDLMDPLNPRRSQIGAQLVIFHQPMPLEATWCDLVGRGAIRTRI